MLLFVCDKVLKTLQGISNGSHSTVLEFLLNIGLQWISYYSGSKSETMISDFFIKLTV